MGHVFISYSRQDVTVVDAIVAKLEAAGIETWVDREDIQAGQQWRLQIVKAIDTADAFVLKLSLHSAASENVRKELDLAEDAAEPFILPVLLDEIKIPAELRYQLAGTQKIEYFRDSEEGYSALETALIARQAEVTPPPEPDPKEVEIIIKGKSLANFDDDFQAKLLAFLTENTGADPDELIITRMEAGSLHVFVKMPTNAGYELKALALNDSIDLQAMGITGLRFVGDKKVIPITQAPSPARILNTLGGRIISGIIGIVAVGALIFGALNLISGPTPTPTPKKPAAHPTETASPTVTPSPLPPTPTPTTSHTSTPTATKTVTATHTTTRTPTSEPPWAQARQNTFCRSGPGANYPLAFGDMTKGEEAPVNGRNVDNFWVRVTLTKYRNPVDCWVSQGENGTVDVFGDLALVPVIPPPPTPTNTPERKPGAGGSSDAEPGSLSGILWDDQNDNQSIDSFEQRFDKVPVTLYVGNCGGLDSDKVYTQNDGSYKFSDLPPGDYCLRIDVADLPPAAYDWKLSGNGHVETVKQNLSISAGGSKVYNFGFVDTDF
jgi:hypothetical protein